MFLWFDLLSRRSSFVSACKFVMFGFLGLFGCWESGLGKEKREMLGKFVCLRNNSQAFAFYHNTKMVSFFLVGMWIGCHSIECLVYSDLTLDCRPRDVRLLGFSLTQSCSIL